MTKPVAKKYLAPPMTYADMSPLEWMDNPSAIDSSFLTEVPLIPSKVEQAFTSPMQIENAIDQLFEIAPPAPWAAFAPLSGYIPLIKRLFKGKILSQCDLELAVEVIDNFYENEGVEEDDDEASDGNKILAMLHELTNLDVILQEITLRVLACLKP